MERISQLSKNLINQISAGEVIERPASVVKELVENSIDAGAKKIEINISNNTRNITISDDGGGIHPDDVELAFVKHATSKIKKEEDLWGITSLGFRGEALSSIISVANLTLTTRTKANEFGIKVENKNSEITKAKTGCAVGTTIEVRDLFHNQPVRLKFLKNERTELGYISEIVKSIAISNPNVSFTLKTNNAIVLSTKGSNDLLTTICDIYPKTNANELVEVHKVDESNNWSVNGYTSLPAFSKSSKKSIHIFLNSRVLRCPIMLKAIDVAYKNKLPIGRFPFVILNVTVPPNEVDVNVHPTKREIRYKAPNQIFSFVQSAIEACIGGFNPITTEFPSFSNYPRQKTNNFFERLNTQNEDTGSYLQVQKQQQFNTEDVMKLYEPIQDQEQPSFNLTSIYSQKTTENIVGQLFNTYILIEHENSLEIVDQHIADERYYYEKLKNQKSDDVQLVLIPDMIELEESDVTLIEEYSSKLSKFGYNIEIHSRTAVSFQTLPQIISHISHQEIISDVLENIKGDIANLEHNILITTSCKAAVKAGQVLSMSQMQRLIENWRVTKNPHTCPHGRPIAKIIDKKEIASFFHRAN